MMESLTIHSFSLENPSIQNVKTPYYKITAAQSKNKTPKTSHIYSHRLSLPMTEKKNIVQHNKTNQAKKNKSKQSINNRFNDTFIPQMLGEGSYGKVFKVFYHNEFLARKRMLKFNGIPVSAVRECTLLNTFFHPFIIKPKFFDISGHGTVDVYMPMAKIDLHKWICQNHSSVRHQLVADVAWRLLNVLKFLHSYNILHRDIKPANVLMDSNNKVFLADFGSIREIIDSNDSNDNDNHNDNDDDNNKMDETSTTTKCPLIDIKIQQTSDMITYAYRPPELSGVHYGVKADIYSLGCTIIHMITKNYPVVEQPNNNNKKPNNISISQSSSSSSRDIPPPPELWVKHFTEYLKFYPSFPIALKDLILSMISRNPNQRPSAAELLNHQIFKSYKNVDIQGSISGEISQQSSQPLQLSQPSQPPSIEKVNLHFLIKLCQHFKMDKTIYIRTIKTFNFLMKCHKLCDSDLNYVWISCFLLICKMMTESYPRIEKLVKITGLLGENIVRMESNVFLNLGYKVIF